MSCANCNKVFIEKPNHSGYYRYSLENSLPCGDESARNILVNITGSQLTPVPNKRQGQFLCPECWSKLNDTAKYQKAVNEFWKRTDNDTYIAQKRRLTLTPGKSPLKKFGRISSPLQKRKSSKSLFTKKGTQATKWDHIITAIRARQYRRAIKGMYGATKGSKRSFIEITKQIVRKEISELLHSDTGNSFPLFQKVNIPNLETFSWDEALTKLQDSCPLLYNALKGAMTSKQCENSLVKGKYVNLKPKIGTVAALILHAKAPRKASSLPTLFPIQFWRGGLKRELIKQLAHTGICKGYDTTLVAVDNISSDFDSAAVVCKEKIEGQFRNAPVAELRQHEAANPDLRFAMAATMQNIEDEIVEPSSSTENINNDNLDDNRDDTIPYGLGESDSDDGDDHEILEESSDDSNVIPVDEDLSLSDEDIAEIDSETEEVEEQEIAHPGFTMCWDNVGKKVTTRNPSEDKKNMYFNMALGYIGVNRVQTTHLDWEVSCELKKAVNLSPGIFVPNAKDTENLENRMKVIVSRIITRHLRWFNRHLGDCTTPHILHEYSKESSERSILINLGVFDVDPSSTQGAITIYENLQRHIPSVREKPYTAIVFGDGLSCERGNDAHCAWCNGLNPWERLEGCEPAVQEFHKEMLLLQDYYDEFFKGSSAADRGTLSHLKNIFNYRQVKSDISDNFNHAWELMCLTTEGYVCLLAMNLLDMKSANDRPNSAPEQIENSSNDDRAQYLHSVSTAIVKELWHHLDLDPLQFDDNSEPDRYCCGEETEEDVILCGAGRNCSHGELFHYTCVGLDPDDFPNNWFCSDACKNHQDIYPYCTCQQDLGNDEPMIGCSAGSRCTGQEWYHLKCITMTADSLPEGDWFCKAACKKAKKGKPKRKSKSASKTDHSPNSDFKCNYSRAIAWVGLNLLCRRDAVREADGEAMLTHWKFDLIHFFSTKHPKYLILAHRLLISVNGWLPDFMNEILNRLFNDILDAAKGRYTKTTIQRCGQIVGPLGEALDSVFDSQIVEKELYRHRRRESNRDKNVERMITFLQGDDLFSTINGRHHRASDPFVHNENPKFPGKFQPKMTQLSKRLDKRRRVIVDA